MTKILYIGDIVGTPGINFAEKILRELRQKHHFNLVIAQSENVTDGRGISLKDYTRLKRMGVDFCTGGNWSLSQKDIWPALSDPNIPIIRPANYPDDIPGLGYKYINTAEGKYLVVSLLGSVVGKQSGEEKDNPLQVIDEIIDSEKDKAKLGIIVNFHGDYSSEKVIIGHYLDGRAIAVIGDHWHVPTSDYMVLPKGTAYISDVGMTGTLNSSLGVSFDSVVPRWRDNVKTRNVLELSGPRQFNAVLIEHDSNGTASYIEQIRITE